MSRQSLSKVYQHGRYPFTHNDQHPVVSLNYTNVIPTHPVPPEQIDQRHSVDNLNSVFPV